MLRSSTDCLVRASGYLWWNIVLTNGRSCVSGCSSANSCSHIHHRKPSKLRHHRLMTVMSDGNLEGVYQVNFDKNFDKNFFQLLALLAFIAHNSHI
jgi:hypothetical protein